MDPTQGQPQPACADGDGAGTVQPLTCGRCGGPFEEGAPRCPWCGGGIALEDRGRSALCPRCNQRAPVAASWCPSCGERIAPQPTAPVGDGRGCPRCEAALRTRRSGERELVECSSCGGLWLPSTVLEAICSEAEREAVLAAVPASPQPAPMEEHVAYLPCPGCGTLMSRRNFGGSSGVVVDVCRAHGVWLDARELERILAWVHAGGPERERRRRVERARGEEACSAPHAPLFPDDPPARVPASLLEELARALGLWS